MAKIGIIGSGQAGCILAYALVKAGYQVTLYSDRTPEQWLTHSAPTGTACLYAEVIDIERELGMDFWSDKMFPAQGVLLESARYAGDPEATVMKGRLEYGRSGGAIDQRMRIHRWLEDFEALGGRLVIEGVTPERADKIALENNLTVLAAGKADLGRLIPRDDHRSFYDRPQRNLAMTIVRSKSGKHVKDWYSDRTPYSSTKFDFFADSGEYFAVPYTHKSAGHTYGFLFEAREGSRMDRFGGCRSGEEVTAHARDIIREFAPWEHHMVDDIEYVSEDPHAWLVGRFAPMVRRPFGRLPSGGLIMPVGDTAITFDPICGQGGNFASRSAKYLAQEIVRHQDKPFDELWMTEVNLGMWEKYGRGGCDLTRIFLETPSPATEIVLHAARNDERAADAYYYGFPHPESIVPALTDVNVARSFAGQFGITQPGT
ncbi:styrene monooxygenase/indole monooxygenase family protein [Mesorhizobium sp.]|uniref:styrene monooxygenase/indole monooxygenase family protein n=1 Tax=Mesorhizobium sp. TaxID=1871066 RepID=UPI000FE9069A|nr:styrene monooxygenase/indole monooxygenase family protein [Mesorhizobium sp.]RWD98767.1 MAG: oxidoreductase [Mesorhizobium sp.]